jgi:hypothetical protein
VVVVVIAPKASVFIVCAKVSQNALGCQSEFSRAQIGQVAPVRATVALSPAARRPTGLLGDATADGTKASKHAP